MKYDPISDEWKDEVAITPATTPEKDALKYGHMALIDLYKADQYFDRQNRGKGCKSEKGAFFKEALGPDINQKAIARLLHPYKHPEAHEKVKSGVVEKDKYTLEVIGEPVFEGPNIRLKYLLDCYPGQEFEAVFKPKDPAKTVEGLCAEETSVLKRLLNAS
jgi:hypothetical protein